MPRNSGGGGGGGGGPLPHNNQGGPGGWGPGPSQFPQRTPMSRGYNNEMGAAYGSYTVSEYFVNVIIFSLFLGGYLPIGTQVHLVFFVFLFLLRSHASFSQPSA